MATEKMWNWINTVIMEFRGCFNRKATFCSFVVILVGLMLRNEHAGITSIIRTLGLTPCGYKALLHFFRSTAWTLECLSKKWIHIVHDSNVLFTENEMPVLIGDGVKQSKEGRKMPCVKRMHQESENSGKPEYIFGHMFGAIGVLVGNAEKLFCLPLYASVQDGDSTIRKWDNKKYKVVSHVVRMIKDAFSVVSVMGSSILLLDAYFFTTSALREWIRQTTEQKNKAHVTRAKISVVAYTKPSAHKGRGRPRKKGAAVKVKELFDAERENFKEMKTVLYGKEESIRYLSKDLLWGKGLYQPLRFVLVEYGARWAIFVCTNLDFSAEQILRLYGYRFKIEVTFRTLKQLLGGFGYHFWSTAMPKLNRFSKKGEPNPLERIRKPEVRMKIREAFSAIERYVMMCLIATGMLQILALKFSSELRENSFSWLRTISKTIPAETTIAGFLRREFFVQFLKNTDLGIVQIIRSKMESNDDFKRSTAA